MDADGRGNLFWNTHYHVSYSHGIAGSLLEGERSTGEAEEKCVVWSVECEVNLDLYYE